jgi:hypothetical protein
VETGRESEVVAVFAQWLADNGWRVRTDVAFADVVAERGDDRLIAEAKGVTSSPGLDMDTLYGQPLRRMTPTQRTRYAIVVPESLVPTASRVSASIRQRLDIDLYGVAMDGTVLKH